VLTIIDLNAEMAKLKMLRGRTPETPEVDRHGSFVRLAPYRDSAINAAKFSGEGPWERHPNGDEIVQVVDGAVTFHIMTEDGPQSHALKAGMVVIGNGDIDTAVPIVAPSSEPADPRVHQIDEQDRPQQEEQRHECNVQPRPRPRPYLFGIDIARGLAEPYRGKSHHYATQRDQQQAGDVADDLTVRRQGPRVDGPARDPEEQVEFLNQKTKRHDGDRRAHPGEERPLIRRMVAMPLDHRTPRSQVVVGANDTPLALMTPASERPSSHWIFT